MKSCLFQESKSNLGMETGQNENGGIDNLTAVTRETQAGDDGSIKDAIAALEDPLPPREVKRQSTIPASVISVPSITSNEQTSSTITSCPFCNKILKKSNSLSSHFLTCKQKKQSQDNITSGGTKKRVPRNRNSNKRIQDILNNHYSLEKENLSNVSGIFAGNSAYLSDFDSINMSETVPNISNQSNTKRCDEELANTVPITTTKVSTGIVSGTTPVHSTVANTVTTAASNGKASGNTTKAWR